MTDEKEKLYVGVVRPDRSGTDIIGIVLDTVIDIGGDS